jgi:hypothetical protein
MGAGITTINLKTAVKDLEVTIDRTVEQLLRERALKAFADVKLATPVDTGIARNSWYIGYTERYINAKEKATSVEIIQKKDKPTEIIVTNGVTYIQFLNNGHSQQAPTKFIESAFSKYFDEVIVNVV